jgi:thiamine-phosphate pyrophosphorylase
LARFCREKGKLFVIDDRLDVAVAAGAGGVHLGQSDLPAEEAAKILPNSMILGISASTLPQAEKALAAGADYLGLGAVISTDSKKDADVISGEDILAINSLGAVTVAIGGITLENAASIKAKGFQGLAVISALTRAPDPEAAARLLSSLE